ncbi:demethylmenaquinone methyltransferase [Flaviflexus equikiangi]|uniref:Demethylmenaquinone methyltransferase n=1 Tax=Flaviflexus equikiangi TaxID=2758573 RepID=A0ABS2TFY0_9ACTO|nr:demethylmenaquinone methyltransferase [Flaviflexus equikiangi]MBM9433542.1 demethylmenaquinone methyltransferase [Flaviflexus equikiangi]
MSRATLKKDPRDVAGMFDDVAKRYDVTNTVLSLGQVYVWRAAVREALGITPGMKVLDIAAGTGTSSVSYAKAGADVVALDFSIGMVTVGKERQPQMEFIAGDATALPFADNTFDAVTISYGLRNVHDPDLALREMLRVVRPGGTLVVCEFSTPTWKPFRDLYNFYLGTVMPTISSVVSSDTEAYDYLMESILAWPNQVDFAARIQEAGWRGVNYRNLSGGIVALHRATKPRGADHSMN